MRGFFSWALFSFLPENVFRLAAAHSKRAFHSLSLVNSIADGVIVREPAPVQSGDEHLAAVERPRELR
jgi:hypothetical protein